MYAEYTCYLKTLMDDPHGKEMLDKAMSSYPLYKKQSKEELIPSYIPTREELNKKILDHYKYREIGFETPGRFIDELEIALNEIMPYYNQLFFSADQDYSMLYNVDYTREFEGTKDGTNKLVGKSVATGTTTSDVTDSSDIDSNTTSHSKNVETTTPQGNISKPAQEISSVTHADKVGWNENVGHDESTSNGESHSSATSTSDGNTTQDVTSKDIDKHIERIKGNYGMVTFQSLIQHYRELILNIEQQIIFDRRIQELFLLIY